MNTAPTSKATILSWRSRHSCYGARQPVAFFLLVLTALAMGGCAGTGPTSADEADESSVRGEPAEAPIKDPVFAEPGRDPTETDPTQGASTDECGSVENPDEQTAQPHCVETEKPDEALLDRTQRTVHEAIENTTRWFDGFFGQSRLSGGEHVSRGRLRVSGLWDQRDGFDSRFNLRARFALPALQDRARVSPWIRT